MNMNPRLKRMSKLLLLVVGTLIWQGCSCCLYLNHVYNTRKYYRKAENSILTRQDTLPSDSSISNKGERESWDKVIKTASLALDRWPDDKQYKAELLWRMGDAYFYKQEYQSSITKYNEFERYFPDDEKLPRVQFQRLRVLDKMAEYNLLINNAEELLINQPEHKYQVEIEDLLAIAYQKTNKESSAIAVLENILNNPNADELSKARAHFKLGLLFYNAKKMDLALPHFNDPLINWLNLLLRQRASFYRIECYLNLNQPDLAISYIDSLISLEDYEAHKWTLSLYKGKTLLNSPLYLEADKILDSLSLVRANVDSASYCQWLIAIHKDTIRQDLTGAIESYTKAQKLRPYSIWGKMANEKILGLRKFSEFQNRDSLSHSDRFQFAEIWLTERNNSDSSIYQINYLLKQDDLDSASRLKALYTKAYLFEWAKKDTLNAHSIYNQILKEYPSTEYARQAEKNLGLMQSSYSLEDQSKFEFAAAESLYYSLDSLKTGDEILYDSLSLIALDQFDSIASKWSQTNTAPKALYLKAWIYETQRGDLEKAKKAYELLSQKFPDTQWGRAALEKINSANDAPLDTAEITRERKTLDDMQRANESRIKRREEWNKKLEEQKPNAEEMLWDYNKMYDF